jgi:hypothetical protein
MVPTSMLIALNPPARIQSCEQSFSETEPFTLEGETLYPGTAPGWWMFDLLFRRNTAASIALHKTKGDFCGTSIGLHTAAIVRVSCLQKS